MKKISIIVVSIFVLLLSSCAPKNENLTGDVQVPKPLTEKNFEDTLKITKLDSDFDVSPEKIHSEGFSNTILKSNGVRIDSGNFKTDFNRKHKLVNQTTLLENANISYYIEITSGPGISPDRKNLSLYSNPDNIVFFAQMLREVMDLNKNNLGFKGIILSIGDPSIDRYNYYSTLNEIANKIDTSNKPLILTLDPLFYESDAKSLPIEYFDKSDIGFNIDMDFELRSYPGKAKFHSTEVELSKNQILEKLITIKNSNKDSKGREIIVSLKCPWSSGCSVLAKDIFEIMKIVDFKFSFSYSNTDDEYDYSNTKDLMSTLSKY